MRPCNCAWFWGRVRGASGRQPYSCTHCELNQQEWGGGLSAGRGHTLARDSRCLPLAWCEPTPMPLKWIEAPEQLCWPWRGLATRRWVVGDCEGMEEQLTRTMI
eukprot:1155393-Pelagomonas_calceolata.AAC.4